MTIDVVIFGGGCSGLWLHRELAARGFHSVLVDAQGLGRFASTRNQGWLQSGALYAISTATGAEKTIRECQEGYRAIEELDRRLSLGALGTRSGGIFLFDTPKKADTASTRLEKAGLWFQRLNDYDLPEVEPLLASPTALQYGLVVNDTAVNSYKVLCGLVAEAHAHGAGFYISPKTSLADVHIEQSSDGEWMIRDKGIRLRARILVCASGALIPQIFDQHVTNNMAFKIKDAVIVSIQQQVCTHIIAIQSEDAHLLNLSPFDGGTTANMGSLDDVAGLDVTTFSERVLRAFGKTVTEFVPSLFDRITPCTVTTYICQKLDLSVEEMTARDVGLRQSTCLEPENNLFILYPGKFTSAPVSAKNLADEISGRLDKPTGREIPSRFTVRPSIARRMYYGAATHVVRRGSKTWRFEKIEG